MNGVQRKIVFKGDPKEIVSKYGKRKFFAYYVRFDCGHDGYRFLKAVGRGWGVCVKCARPLMDADKEQTQFNFK